MNESNYDERYFEWQKQIGEFGGKANLFKFEDWIGSDDDVLDFGCGGGYLLKNIKTSGKKIGVEINPAAQKTAIENGVTVYKYLKEVSDNSVDVAISNHALEHVQDPYKTLIQLKRVVRPDGFIVIVVPHESSKEVNIADKNMHLFTWSPQNLVNLFKECEIEVVDYESICHMWVPHYQMVQKIIGWELFHALCEFYCKIKKTGYQTLVIGKVNK